MSDLDFLTQDARDVIQICLFAPEEWKSVFQSIFETKMSGKRLESIESFIKKNSDTAKRHENIKFLLGKMDKISNEKLDTVFQGGLQRFETGLRAKVREDEMKTMNIKDRLTILKAYISIYENENWVQSLENTLGVDSLKLSLKNYVSSFKKDVVNKEIDKDVFKFAVKAYTSTRNSK